MTVCQSGNPGTSAEGHRDKRPRTGQAEACPKSAAQPASLDTLEDDSDCLAYDTVGAVCVDAHGATQLSFNAASYTPRLAEFTVAVRVC